ncbi:MAG TPA: SAM-dependent methyltransferase [Amycolatopsis sp.]|nr:SAM-dependent methyltransferase [Amycolatopsis sp.]
MTKPDDELDMSRPEWTPPAVDLDRPNVSRIYDWYLGGTNNYAVDREFGKAALEVMPHIPFVARSNREFMIRAVGYALDEGLDQFLDIGSGIPTTQPVHEVAHARDPGARVVYVDHEAVAIAHGTRMLTDEPNAAMVAGDFYRPETILDAPETRRLIDFDRPVCLLLVALLHFVPPSDDPESTLRQYLDKLAPGSLVAISHGTFDGLDPADPRQAEMREATLRFTAHYNQTSTPDLVTRTRDEFAAFFTGLELVEPGIAYTRSWRNDSLRRNENPAFSQCLAGVARVPSR